MTSTRTVKIYRKHGYHSFRAWIARQHHSVVVAYKALVGLIGGLVILGGIILIPLPGPGWLIVFFGLALLGLEFPAAHRLNLFVKKKFKKAWDKARHKEAPST